MVHTLSPLQPRPEGQPRPDREACLGRTCMKWSADGELTDLDFQLILERLGAVDAVLGDALAAAEQGGEAPG
jgi:hypothetical protein